MKKSILLLAILAVLLTTVMYSTEKNPIENTETENNPFCNGWRNGYVEGYCYNSRGVCLTPIVPICPLPGISGNSYSEGYNRGFLAGLSRRN